MLNRQRHCETMSGDIGHHLNEYSGDLLLQDVWLAAFAPSERHHNISAPEAPPLTLLERRAGVERFFLRCLVSPTNEHSPRFACELSLGQLRTALAESRRRLRWGTLEFDLIPEHSALHHHVEALRREGWPIECRPWQRSAVIHLPDEPQVYFGALPRQVRKNLRNSQHRADQRNEPFVFEEVSRDTRWHHWLESALAVEEKSWKGGGGTAINQNSATRRFYRDLFSRFREQGRIRLHILRENEVLVAFSAAVILGDTMYLLKISHDPDYDYYRPGNLLRRHVIEQAIAHEPVRHLDLGYPVTEWKQQWCNDSQTLLRITVYARAPLPRLVHLGRHHLRTLRTRWRQRSATAAE